MTSYSSTILLCPPSYLVYLGSFSPLLDESGQRFVNFVYIFKKTSSWFYWFFLLFFWISVLLIFSLTFMISFLLLALGFVCSYFSNSFRGWVKLLIWDFFFLSCIAMNFPIRTAFAASHRFEWFCTPVSFSILYFTPLINYFCLLTTIMDTVSIIRKQNLSLLVQIYSLFLLQVWIH